jgi:subtilisin family serine protease
MRLVKALALTALLLAPSLAFAGEIHPALAERMDAATADEAIKVIVTMTEQAPIAELNQSLKQERATLDRRHREVILSLQDVARSQTALRSWLDAELTRGAVRGYTPHWIANLVVVSATPGAIAAIAARPDVAFVELDFKAELIAPVTMPSPNSDLGETGGTRGIGVSPGVRALNAPQVWYELGITGAGRLVANLDTGVDGNHPALASRWRGTHAPLAECWLDVLGGEPNFPADNYGHGTHVMGTITGRAPDDSVGVAPGAEWIACNAIDQGVGSEFDNDVINALEWFADPDGNPFTTADVPDVLQNSWGINEGFGAGYTDCDVRWWAAIDGCEAAGVVITWSAGNEGPTGTSLRSPADRAASAYNVFSVGAVDATNYGWPYPIASFSSRGPTGCNVVPALKIKPEVSAPGVDVYSSVPGGGYSSGYSGTSMAGPHVAGIVGLMREANPDLDVDTIKQILIETARDEGTAGEDNTYGWGFVDAYAAVLAAMEGFGSLEGYVRNASYGNVPLPGANVALVSTTFDWNTDATGFYHGSASASSYTARASMAGFASQDVAVTVNDGSVTVQNFALTDNAGPTLSNLTPGGSTSNAAGPYPVNVNAQDYSSVAAVTLYYRINMGAWQTVPMMGGPLTFTGNLPGSFANSHLDYYVQATDGVSHSSVLPAGAPLAFETLYITEQVYTFDAESGQGGWALGAAGDAATSGLWVWADPVGTDYGGVAMQPENDHTPTPGVYCFVTGNGAVGGAVGDADVDGGCTTLVSPVFDLSGADRAFVRYWRWYGEGGNSSDDDFVVQISSNGSTWVELERVVNIANSWTLVNEEVTGLVPLTSTVQLRFVACDLNTAGLTEAAIDDVSIEAFAADLTAVPGDLTPQWSLQLLQSQPNPFRPGDGPTTLRFSLETQTRARLAVYDISGRLVRTLADAAYTPGEHALTWDGKDAHGQQVSSGVYFYRLEAQGQSQSRSLVLVR